MEIKVKKAKGDKKKTIMIELGIYELLYLDLGDTSAEGSRVRDSNEMFPLSRS